MDKNQSQKTIAEKKGTGVIGTTQIILGVGVALIAAFSTWLSVWIIGIALTLWGIMDIRMHFKNKTPWWSLVLGVIAFCAGLQLLLYPGIGAAAFSLVLAILFILGGIDKVLNVFRTRQVDWKLTLFSGLISVLLGVLIFSLWPIKSFMFLGILTGIEIILNGLIITVVGATTKRIKADYFHRYPRNNASSA
jgi:uncharacterized membrane protein HdeD (DUF308 family)